MHKIWDNLCLLAFCFLQLLFLPADALFVLSFLLALILLCGSLLFLFDTTGWVRMGLYLLCCLLSPSFCLFLPAVAYTALGLKLWAVPVFGLLYSGYAFLAAQHRPACFFLILFGVLLAFLLFVKTDRILSLEEEYHRSTDDSREKNFLLKEKNKALREKQDYEIYTATLKERNRIAREIHDNVGHLLSRCILLCGAMKMMNKEEALSEPLSNLDNSLNCAMTSIRESVHDLHDDAIDLQTAAQDLLASFTFCPVQFTYDMGCGLPKELKYCYLSILKEALNNIIRHSNATQVQITMREQPALYQLVITDNGSRITLQKGGIGLSNMAERVEALGGQLRLHTEQGFEIFITIPKELHA